MDVKRHRIAGIVVVLGFVAAACGQDATEPTTITPASTSPEATSSSEATSPASSVTTAPPVAGVESSADLPGDLPLVTAVWATDWSMTTIDFSELRIGILMTDPRDAIPPIDQPRFDTVEDASAWLEDRDPGVLVETDAGARFYPLAILTRHEIVNDDFGGIPMAVTYCPLCNTALVFDRRVDGEVHRFGVSGLLRNSDLVMWDDVTQSLWQQITGEGIVGTRAGTWLTPVPSSIVAYSEFAGGFENGEVLSRDTGFGIPYGLNPYEFYSSRERPYGFFEGDIDPRYPALERVVGVTIDTGTKAYPFSEIAALGVVNDAIGVTPVVVFWGGETADALDGSIIADSRAIGTGVAYSPVVDGEILTFSQVSDSVFEDEETGSRWTILGRATDGPLAGRSLETLVHRNEFWFAWSAFFADAPVYED
jgi:hypothetical protein